MSVRYYSVYKCERCGKESSDQTDYRTFAVEYVMSLRRANIFHICHDCRNFIPTWLQDLLFPES